MDVMTFIFSKCSSFIRVLDSTNTIIGISWYNLFFSLIVIEFMIVFFISLIKRTQMERTIGDSMRKSNKPERVYVGSRVVDGKREDIYRNK